MTEGAALHLGPSVRLLVVGPEDRPRDLRDVFAGMEEALAPPPLQTLRGDWMLRLLEHVAEVRLEVTPGVGHVRNVGRSRPLLGSTRRIARVSRSVDVTEARKNDRANLPGLLHTERDRNVPQSVQ